MSVLKYALAVIAGLLLGIYEQSMRSFLPAPLDMLWPVFPVVVLLASMNRWSYALVLGGSAGAIADVFVLEHAHFSVVENLLIISLLMVVARAVFTNRSLYAALALASLAWLMDWAWLELVQLVVSSDVPLRLAPEWRQSFAILGLQLAFTAVLFLFSVFILQRLKWYRRKIETYG